MIIPEMSIASMNVRSLGQGLHGARKRCEVRDFLRRTTPQVEILLLQEHCYSLEDCLDKTHQLHFQHGASYWNNALYSANGNKFHAGTAISLSRKFAELVIHTAAPIEGRANYVILNVNGQKVGLLNIYAPNRTGPRARFWGALADHVFPQADWVVGGDFNMVEDAEDRTADFHANNIGRREEGAWGRFLQHLGIQDVFYSDEYRRLGSKRHTWRRERPQPTWSRIDRFYASNTIRTKGGRHGIWPTLDHISDHAGIFLQIPLAPRARPQRPRFDSRHVQDPEAIQAFSDSWRQAMSEPGDFSKATRVTTALEQIRRISASMATDRKRKNRETYATQFVATSEAEAALEQDWNDLGAWARLNEAQAELESVRLSKLEATRNHMAAKWTLVGDRCSKEFFEFNKPTSKKAIISELVDNGRSLRSPAEIEQHIKTFTSTSIPGTPKLR